MKCAEGYTFRCFAQHAMNALFHLTSSFVGERHCQNAVWTNATVVDEVSDSMSDDTSLTTTGPRDD